MIHQMFGFCIFAIRHQFDKKVLIFAEMQSLWVLAAPDGRRWVVVAAGTVYGYMRQR